MPSPRARTALTIAATACALAATARPASAALTDSERAQIKGFVRGHELASAERVRALVARPDLTVDEGAEALSDAARDVTFAPASAAYFRELVFGGASLAARPLLVPVVVRALLARAEVLLGRDGLAGRTEVLDELSRVYAFIGGEVANAGHPRGAAHDPSMGIPQSTYDDCVHVMSEHVQRHGRWLSPESPVPPAFARVRAQEELALYDLTGDSPTRRADAASAIGLTGARRRVLTELGVLVLDSGSADDARVQRLRNFYVRLGAITAGGTEPAGLEAIAFGDPRPLLGARGSVVAVAVPLETAPAPVPSEEVQTVAVDLPLFVLAYELAKPLSARVLAGKPELRRWTEGDAKVGAGRGGMPAVERLAGMMAELVVDAPRAIDLAFAEALAGRPRDAGLLSDALGALAESGPGASGASTGLSVALGRSTGPNGETDRLDASSVHLAPSGAASSFQIDRRTWELTRDAAGTPDGARCDGQPVTLAILRLARVPVTESTSWKAGGLVFARLAGTPRAGGATGSRLRVVGVGAAGNDAIATPAPGDDVVIDADLTVTGGEGGLVARAASTAGAFQGLSLVVLPGAPARALFRLNDGKGGDSNVGQPVNLPSDSVHAKLSVRGSAAEADLSTVAAAGSTGATVTLKTTLPSALAHGDVAIRAKTGATVEVSGLTIRRAR